MDFRASEIPIFAPNPYKCGHIKIFGFQLQIYGFGAKIGISEVFEIPIFYRSRPLMGAHGEIPEKSLEILKNAPNPKKCAKSRF